MSTVWAETAQPPSGQGCLHCPVCAGGGEDGEGDNRPTRSEASLALRYRTLRNIRQQSLWVERRDPARPSSSLSTASVPTACHVAKNVLGILEASGIAPKKSEPQALEIPQGTKVSVGHRMSMLLSLGSQHPPQWDLGVPCDHSSRTRFWQD